MKTQRIRTVQIAAALSVILSLVGCTGPLSGVHDRDNVVIETRDAWPEGYPLRIRLKWATSPTTADLEITAKPRFKGGKVARHFVPDIFKMVTYASDYLFSDKTQDVGVPPPGESVEFDVRLKRSDITILNGIWRERRVVPVRVGGTIDDVLQPVTSTKVDEAMQEQLHLRLVTSWWESKTETSGPSAEWCMLRINRLPQMLPEMQELTFAVKFELLRNAEVVGVERAWWEQEDKAIGARFDFDDYNAVGPFDLSGIDITKPAEWGVRLTPLPEMALRNFQSVRYWHGDVTVPLEIAALVRRINSEDPDQREEEWVILNER